MAQSASGVDQVFHQPFAWFGRRTAARRRLDRHRRGPAAGGRRRPGPEAGFFPTETALSYGMPLILDLAPAARGLQRRRRRTRAPSAPTPSSTNSTAAWPGSARSCSRACAAGETLRAIYRALDELLAEHDAQNCHRHYPDGALGHLVFPLEPDPPRPTPLRGFGTAAAEGLVAASLGALERGTGYPIWNDRALADRPAAPGLWAVEPHIGRDGVGVKFEELLVVTEDDAYWLDDHLPHTQRWAAAGYSTELCGQR